MLKFEDFKHFDVSIVKDSIFLFSVVLLLRLFLYRKEEFNSMLLCLGAQ